MLSTNGDGSVVDLWVGDQSGRQKWLFEPHSGPRGNYFNIIVQGEVNGPRHYLSTNIDGSVVDLWSSDDGSGRQQWIIQPSYDDPSVAVIRIAGGVNGPRAFLSCTADGTRVDLFVRDDGSGRQRWKIQPVEVVAPVPVGLPMNKMANFQPTHGGKIGMMNFRYTDQVTAVMDTKVWPGARVYVFQQQVADTQDLRRLSFDPTNPAIGNMTFTVRQITPTLQFNEPFPMIKDEANNSFWLVVEVY
jgi:hypothetical protein